MRSLAYAITCTLISFVSIHEATADGLHGGAGSAAAPCNCGGGVTAGAAAAPVAAMAPAVEPTVSVPINEAAMIPPSQGNPGQCASCDFPTIYPVQAPFNPCPTCPSTPNWSGGSPQWPDMGSSQILPAPEPPPWYCPPTIMAARPLPKLPLIPATRIPANYPPSPQAFGNGYGSGQALPYSSGQAW